jgi:hypothetical protein
MVTMSQKSSLPQVAIFVSQVLIPDIPFRVSLALNRSAGESKLLTKHRSSITAKYSGS